MLALALATTDTTLVFLPLTAFAAMMGYLVILDPRAGLDIDARAVSFWRGHRRETIAVAEIERVHVEHWSDSVDVTIHRQRRRDGRCSRAVSPGIALPNAGVAAGRRRGDGALTGSQAVSRPGSRAIPELGHLLPVWLYYATGAALLAVLSRPAAQTLAPLAWGKFRSCSPLAHPALSAASRRRRHQDRGGSDRQALRRRALLIDSSMNFLARSSVSNSPRFVARPRRRTAAPTRGSTGRARRPWNRARAWPG